MAAGVLCSGAIVYDTLVRPAGEANWGTTTLVDTIEFHTGGNGANTSLTLAKCGAPVRLLSAVGNDEQGKFALEALRREGVETQAVSILDGRTAATVALVNHAGDRRFLHRMGVNAEAFPEPIEFSAAIVRGMAHYHLASLFILPRFRAHARETLMRARAAGLTTSLDTNWDPQGRWLHDLGPCLDRLDFLVVNEDEARMITGSALPSEAAAFLLARGVRTAVVKLGPRGCAIYTVNRPIACPAFDVEARDTTGAGDCFVGGFLAALLSGSDLEEAGRFANAVAALSVQAVGGAAGVPGKSDIDAWLRSARVR